MQAAGVSKRSRQTGQALDDRGGPRSGRPRTQLERVLELLRRRGERGINAVDFFAPTADGGPPLTRLSSRIFELRAAGHRIDTAGRRSKCVVYKLVTSPPPPRHEPAPPLDSPALFDVAPDAPPPACAVRAEWVS
jgi:hypothetical protein